MSEGIANAPQTIDPMVAAAHELKAPLTIIAHIAASAEREFASMSAAEQRLALQRIRLSAERTLRLVRGLTIGQQLTQYDQLGFNFESLNITQLCEEVIDEALPFAVAQSQLICLQPTIRPQLVVGNRELMQSVLFNLIDNAMKHNPPKTEVKLSISRRSTMIRVDVQDNGPGFRPNDFKRLSQTIGREIQPLRGRAGSSGLGLYIAGQMVSAMGGKLGFGRASSGARFYIDLIRSQQLSLL